jgi:hypothetical protein
MMDANIKIVYVDFTIFRGIESNMVSVEEFKTFVCLIGACAALCT